MADNLLQRTLRMTGLALGLLAQAAWAQEYRVRSAPRNPVRPAAPTSRPVIPPQRNPRQKPETLWQLLRVRPDASLAAVEPFIAGDPNRSDFPDRDDPLLMEAIRNHREDIARVLIERGANVNWSPSYDPSWKPIGAACIAGSSPEFIQYLISKGAKLEPKGKDKRTLLHFAADGGNVKVARFLISKGFEVKAAHPSEGTPLDTAIDCNQLEMARFLIQSGGQVMHRDKSKRTPLHRAATRGNAKMVELLIASGAEVNARDKYGRTPLTIAADADYKEAVAVLKKHKATE